MKLNNNDDSHNSGLNLLIYNMLLDIESHPAWVCGLKLNDCFIIQYESESHPAWVCGLKPKYAKGTDSHKVTPCVGVWIETGIAFLLTNPEESHPAWVCGLKPSWEAARAARPVTPCVGVWIETENN